jgi:tetratricopeptide (TPR) repeat protein
VSDLSDAITVYEAVGAKTKAASATASLGGLLVQNARPADALAAVERARAFVGEGDSAERSRLLSTQGFAIAMTPDPDLLLAETQGAFAALAMAYLLRVSVDLARGDLEGVSESLRLSTQSFEMGGFPWGRDNDGHGLGILLLAGKDEPARQALDRLATGFVEGMNWSGQLEGYWLSGKAYLGDGDILEEYRRYRSRLPRPGRAMSGGSVAFLTHAIEALAVAGEKQEAGKLYPLIAEFVASDVGLFAFTSGLHERFAGIAAAAAGDWASAERHFQHSLKLVDEERPHRVDQAPLRYWYGRMLLDRRGSGDAERARELLARARELGKDMGLHGLIAWIDALDEGSQAAR